MQSRELSKKTKYLYGGTTFETCLLSKSGFSLSPQPYLVTELAYRNQIIRDLHSIWDISKFRVPRIPVTIGTLSDVDAFNRPIARVLDMPIKLAGSNVYKIPSDLEPFRSAIQIIINHEHSVLSEAQLLSYHAYLTIDQSEVKQGEMQRKPGAHVDGFQGARIFPKTIINHSYVVSNGTPTVFYPQSFDFSYLDERLHNFFLEMDKQALEKKSMRTKPYTVYLMDAYTVHRADIAFASCFRTFLRISFDVKEFDRLGNTINPLLDYHWKMVPREAQSTLVTFQPLTNEEENILIKKDLILLAQCLVSLKKTNLEHYYNFTYIALHSENLHIVKLALMSLLKTDKPNIQELRLFFIAAVSKNLSTAYLGKLALISHLNLATGNIQENLLNDFILEMIVQNPHLLPKEFLATLTNQEDHKPKINPVSFWQMPKQKNEEPTLSLQSKL